MALFDVPEAVAYHRTRICAAVAATGSGAASGSAAAAARAAVLDRLQAAAFYGGSLAYYWIFATPAVAAVFGLYLYIAVNWFNVHFDESFSSLRIANHKGFSRLHITKGGDLEIFTLAVDSVPNAWRQVGWVFALVFSAADC